MKLTLNPFHFHHFWTSKTQTLSQWPNWFKTLPNRSWITFGTCLQYHLTIRHLRTWCDPSKPHDFHPWASPYQVLDLVAKPVQNHAQQTMFHTYDVCVCLPLPQNNQKCKSPLKMSYNSHISSHGSLLSKPLSKHFASSNPIPNAPKWHIQPSQTLILVQSWPENQIQFQLLTYNFQNMNKVTSFFQISNQWHFDFKNHSHSSHTSY